MKEILKTALTISAVLGMHGHVFELDCQPGTLKFLGKDFIVAILAQFFAMPGQYEDSFE